MTCALCDLVRDPRRLGAGGRSVYEDEVAMVLVDSAPARREQAWVIPKAHYGALSDLDERTGLHLVKLGMRAALSLGMSADHDVQVLLEGDATAAEPHVHVRVRSRGEAAAERLQTRPRARLVKVGMPGSDQPVPARASSSEKR